MTPARKRNAGCGPGGFGKATADDCKLIPAEAPPQRWCVIVDNSHGPRLWGSHRDRSEAERVAALLRKHSLPARVEGES